MHKSRIRTLQAILAGTCIGVSPAGVVVHGEFEAVHQAGRIRNPSRRRILQVLHSARALDSGLKAFVQHHRCQEPGKPPPNAMGGYLHALQKHRIAGLGQITGTQRSHFQAAIVSKRNTFLHEAGMYPANEVEVETLVSEMHVCPATVVAL